MRRYTIIIYPDDSGYSVDVPALPGCHSSGDTIEEARANAKEAIEGYLLSLKDAGEPIPVETTPPQTAVIEVAA